MPSRQFGYPCRIVDKVCRVHVPSLVSRHGPLLATPPFPPSGPSEPGSPLSQVIKALRLPTCASAVAYFVHFRRPRDPSVFVFAIAPEAPARSWRGGGPLPAPGLGCRPPAVPAHSWDANGISQVSR